MTKRDHEGRWWRDQFESVGNSETCWCIYAKRLLDSSDYLAAALSRATAGPPEDWDPDTPELGFLSPKWLLRGLAIECLFKALYVKDGGQLAESGELAKPAGVGLHNLRQWADRTGVKILPREGEFLDKMTRVIKSRGRYPIAVNWREHKVGFQKGAWSRGDESDFDSILAKLSSRLEDSPFVDRPLKVPVDQGSTSAV